MTAWVIDSSVAVKWFLPPVHEQLVAEAQDLLRRYENGELQFLVPDVFWAESGNIFWKAVRSLRCSREDAERSLSLLKSGRLLTVPSFALLNVAFEIAADFDRSFYDSLYVALAVESQTRLVTADEKLVNAVAGHLPVTWLGAL